MKCKECEHFRISRLNIPNVFNVYCDKYKLFEELFEEEVDRLSCLKDVNKIFHEIYMKGRKDGIDEYNAQIKQHCSIVGSCDFEDLDKLAERIKAVHDD